MLPVAEPSPEVLRRTEQRAVVLQLERLMDYPMVRERAEAGQLSLHGWHYVIEDGEVHVFDVQRGGFVPAAEAENAGTGPYRAHVGDGGVRELVDGCGVRVDGSVVSDRGLRLAAGTYVVQVGKRRFARVTLKP